MWINHTAQIDKIYESDKSSKVYVNVQVVSDICVHVVNSLCGALLRASSHSKKCTAPGDRKKLPAQRQLYMQRWAAARRLKDSHLSVQRLVEPAGTYM